jgi:hypothetical protein
MKKEIKCNVVMLATQNPSEGVCWLNNNMPKSRLENYPPRLESFGWVGQHFYLTDDSEIKEGDWNVHKFKTFDGVIDTIVTNKIFIGGDYGTISKKKIIAATDKLRVGAFMGFEPDSGIDCSDFIPQPKTESVLELIKSYNKGKIITQVLVECEESFDNNPSDSKI